MEAGKPPDSVRGWPTCLGWYAAISAAVPFCALFIVIGFCTGISLAAIADAKRPGEIQSSDLYVVDCLLPGQLRKLGNRTYMTPRRPIRTTAVDCAIRGGEYTAWDRANYQTALRVWLPAAEEGDPEAMNYVGEIFERGLGAEPNLEIARFWYERAASAGYKPAQVNLAVLYDTGRGVDRDPVAAINWYRRAWGVPNEELLISTEKVASERADNAAKLAQAEAETESLALLAAIQQDTIESLTAERDELAEENKRLSSNRDSLLALLNEMPVPPVQDVASGVVTLGQAHQIERDGRRYGRFYALVIGNGNHRVLADLKTPLSDARRVADLLADRYGFEVTRIDNGDDIVILEALNELHEKLEPSDNLLIYYAGYGNARTDGSLEVGYWLPVNADRPPTDTYWLPVAQIGAHLARLPARRIIVIADSSFAGLVAETPAFFFAMRPELLVSDAYINLRFENRSRLLISSNQDFPRESNGDGLSAFTTGLASVLEGSTGILPAPALFLQLREALGGGMAAIQPTFKAIKSSGDAVGDFYFVPQH